MFLPIIQTITITRTENFVSTTKNLLKKRNWIFPVLHYFTWKLEFLSIILWTIVVNNFTWKLGFLSNILWTIVVNTFSIAVHVLCNLFWKNIPTICASFNHVFKVIRGIFFSFLLKRKDALGKRLTKDLRQTLVFLCKSVLREKFDLCFSRYFYLYRQNFHVGTRTEN